MQDQIGGESRPGSLSAFEGTRSLGVCSGESYDPRVIALTDGPSGRSLDPGREAGARGMIVTALTRKHSQKWLCHAEATYRIRLTWLARHFQQLTSVKDSLRQQPSLAEFSLTVSNNEAQQILI